MRPGQKIENFCDTRFPLTLDPFTRVYCVT
jgi:hypothetical protein